MPGTMSNVDTLWTVDLRMHRVTLCRVLAMTRGSVSVGLDRNGGTALTDGLGNRFISPFVADASGCMSCGA